MKTLICPNWGMIFDERDIQPVPPPTPIPPPNPTPIPPPVNGEPWPWNTMPEFTLNSGQEKVSVVNITKQTIYLKMSIAGLNTTTLGAFSWIFPDGRIYPKQPNQGKSTIDGQSSSGLLALRSSKYSGSFNIPDEYIPQGDHIFRIVGNANNSWFKVFIEAY